MPTRIILAARRRLIRDGLRSLLDGVPDFDLLDDVGTLTDLHDNPVLRKADVVILEMTILGSACFQGLQRLIARSRSFRVVLICAHANAPLAEQALRSGASAFVSMDDGFAELENAIRAVADGETYVTSELTPAPPSLTEGVTGGGAHAEESLTPREYEVIRMAAEGVTSKQIAERLAISERTAETHRARAMQKLGLMSAVGLVRYALSRGMVFFE
ncbi:DNA-binding response regulator [Capsulimonas corticalis]|uniref:DNA-binding response regulator n=1 Tax=Capsulimonas corticalis TaxID=2219043 RepID=A0A402D0W5_9BACT|nr:response regulator transcription factor [Capsulimonas corticalis]BDI33527.1 DNA-binding response regulator [Capsulimonas corticalis]